MIDRQNFFIKKSKSNSIVLFLIFLGLTSCKPPVSVDDLACSVPPINKPSARSNNLTVAIHVDGTPSMQGYVNNPSESRYSKTLKVLDETARLNSIKVEYYRLGTKSSPISQEQYLKVTEPNFYSGNSSSFPLLAVSQIETAITPPENQETLSIIVTDLYQKNTDITAITERIKKYYFKHNNSDYAVGIMGIKSEFNGTIFLEDSRNSKLNYQTTSKKNEQYHPFYLIFLGRYSDIAHYFNKLANNTNTKQLIAEGETVIFSPDYLIKNIATLQEYPELPLEEDISRPISLNDGNVAIEKEDRSIELLEIDSREQDNLNLQYNVTLNYFPYTLKVEPSQIKTNPDLQTFDSFEKIFKEVNNNSSLRNNLTLTEWTSNDSNNNLSFSLSINSGKLESGVYLFNVDAIPQGLKSQSWWQEWNGSSQEILNGEGGKTYNLGRFLEQLKNVTTEAMLSGEKTNLLGRFCYAIQRN